MIREPCPIFYMEGIPATDETESIDTLLNNKNNRLLSAVFIFLFFARGGLRQKMDYTLSGSGSVW